MRLLGVGIIDVFSTYVGFSPLNINVTLTLGKYPISLSERP
jgi:hypothetical protein